MIKERDSYDKLVDDMLVSGFDKHMTFVKPADQREVLAKISKWLFSGDFDNIHAIRLSDKLNFHHYTKIKKFAGESRDFDISFVVNKTRYFFGFNYSEDI